jgi:hypothetical protein
MWFETKKEWWKVKYLIAPEMIDSSLTESNEVNG